MPGLRLHTIKPAKGSRFKRKRVGRGEGCGKGKTSGRGEKGQRSRSGGKSGLKLKGMKQMLLRIPKVRGFKSGRIHPKTITLAQLDRWFESGSEVRVKTLKARNLIPMNVPSAKVVDTGKITKKLALMDILATPTAKAAIEKAGGTVADVPKKKASPRKLAKKASKK